MSGAPDRRTLALLAVLSIVYVGLFVPANLTGSANASMLGVFQLDEFGQYRVIWRMTSPAESVGEALRQFVAYDYYSYGFPFFAGSALAFWPLRASYLASGEAGLTQAAMLVLRELSPLLHVASIWILVALWTGLRAPLRAGALFVFLAALPAVFTDGLWWHPDAWSGFFVVATIALLVRDRRRLGPSFYAAAAICGLAVATKLVGLWFFAAVALVLLRAERSWPQRIAHGIGFTAVMVLATLAASPMLFVPGEAARVWETISPVHSIISFGWGERGESGIAAWADALSDGFGGFVVLAIAIAAAIATIVRDPAHRDLAATLLAWALPLLLYVVFGVAYVNERYLLPALLPLVSCVGAPIAWRWLADARAPRAGRLAVAALAALLAVQLSVFVRTDLWRYRQVLHREANSASLAFHRDFERAVLSKLPPDQPLRVLRDPYVYLPPSPRIQEHLRWRPFEHGDLEAVDPDLVLLRRVEIGRFADPEIVARAYHPERAERGHRFYRDVAGDALPGYRQIFESDFAVALGRVR